MLRRALCAGRVTRVIAATTSSSCCRREVNTRTTAAASMGTACPPSSSPSSSSSRSLPFIACGPLPRIMSSSRSCVGGGVEVHARCSGGAAALTTPARRQGSLNKLLEDPNDVYLAGIMAYDLPRIANVAADDAPRTDGTGDDSDLYREADVPAEVLAEATAAAIAEAAAAAAAPTAGRPGASPDSPATAVLQSLHEEGLRKKVEAERVAVARRAAVRAAFEALPEAEKQRRRDARAARHLWDGLCAVNAVLRTSVEVAEDGSGEGRQEEQQQQHDRPLRAKRLPEEDIAAVWRVYATVRGARGRIEDALWKEDFVPELIEMAIFLRAMGEDGTIDLE